jgi:hypothetical protein
MSPLYRFGRLGQVYYGIHPEDQNPFDWWTVDGEHCFAWGAVTIILTPGWVLRRPSGKPRLRVV